MTGQAEGADGTGEAEAPAAVGGRLGVKPDRVIHYTLDYSDALVWERASPPHRKRDKVALFAAFFAGLGLLKMLGGVMTDLAPLHTVPMAVLLMAAPFGLVILLQRRDLRQRAQRRADQRIGVRLEIWGDRLVEYRDDRKEPLAFGALSMREVREEETHVFLSTGREVMIVPTRAFLNPAAKTAFAEEWQAKID